MSARTPTGFASARIPDPSPAVFRMSNVGPIREASFKLGNLTVIAGANNTGKTYLAHLLYTFLRTWRDWPGAASFLYRGPADFPSLSGVVDTLRETGRAVVPVPARALLDQRRALMDALSRAFSGEHLPQVFGATRDDFPNARLGLELDDEAAGLRPTPFSNAMGPHSLTLGHANDRIVAVADTRGNSHADDDMDLLVARSYYLFALRDLFPEPFVVSAERSTISMFHRELDFRKHQLLDALLNLDKTQKSRRGVPMYVMKEDAMSKFALPVQDNIDFAQEIADLPKKASELERHRLSDLVKNMAGGYFSNSSKDAVSFISKARGKGRSFNIPVHLASSSARGLMDLYFFLKHAARRGQFLVIDQPESFLDTANQVAFARALAAFARAGLQALVTTHSDFMVRELNNLVMLDSDFPGKLHLAHRLGYKDGESVDPAMIRAYVAENGGLTECEVGPRGIEMPIFDRTLARQNRVAAALSSRLDGKA